MEHILLPSPRTLGLPFCSAVRAGDFLFLSGAIGDRTGTMRLVEDGLSAQARQAMENIGEVLGACGLGFADTVKIHHHVGRDAAMGRVQRRLPQLLRSRAVAGALRLRRERARAWR